MDLNYIAAIRLKNTWVLTPLTIKLSYSFLFFYFGGLPRTWYIAPVDKLMYQFFTPSVLNTHVSNVTTYTDVFCKTKKKTKN